MKIDTEQTFWITNVSKKDVMLADLAFSLKTGRSYNLLDNKHFNYTFEQLKQSFESGSISKKIHLLIIGKGPKQKAEYTILKSKRPMQTKLRTAVKLENKQLDDFNLTNEQYAKEIADEINKEK